MFNPSEKSSGGPTGPVSPPSTVPAVLMGGSDDTRLLLRGLLRLHHHRVVLETPAREGIDRLPPSSEVKVLIVDTGSEKDTAWAEELRAVLQSRPDLRAIVILSSPDAGLETRARSAGARAILVRPFAIRDFVEAVDTVAAGS